MALAVLLLLAPVQDQRLKGKKGAAAYEKAVSYVRENLPKAKFAAKMVIGWLLLADGRCPQDLKTVVDEALQWDKRRGKQQHSQHWYPALAGMFLAEYYKHRPEEWVKVCLRQIVDEFVKNQERTGGWFKWFEGTYKDRLDYPVKDLGILTSIIYGVMLSARKHGVKVPATTLEKAEKCLMGIFGGRGISYGTPQRGGDKTGARGAFLMLGLETAGMKSHRVWTTYQELLPRNLKNMDQGHHVGAFHCLGVTLGCRMVGATAKQVNEWADKLIAKQEPDGGVYVGDDGDAGGEIGLLKSNFGSTAAFALMLLMQDPDVLRPKRKSSKKPGQSSRPPGSSPFRRKR